MPVVRFHAERHSLGRGQLAGRRHGAVPDACEPKRSDGFLFGQEDALFAQEVRQAVEFQSRVVGNHRVGRQAGRDQERVDGRQDSRAKGCRSNGVKAAPDRLKAPLLSVIREEGLPGRGIGRAVLLPPREEAVRFIDGEDRVQGEKGFKRSVGHLFI
ncbi:MAG: hypothetical protein ACRYFS_19795 [Janthinobacterium lividum]